MNSRANVCGTVAALVASLLTPNSHAACGTPTFHGGRLVQHAKVYVTYWGFGTPLNDPDGLVQRTHDFFAGIGGTPWNDVVTQYDNGSTKIYNDASILKGEWYDNTNSISNGYPGVVVCTSASPCISTDAVGAEAQAAAYHFYLAGQLPGGYQEPDAIQVVVTPSNVQHYNIGEIHVCAVHGHRQVSPNPETIFLEMPYTSRAKYPWFDPNALTWTQFSCDAPSGVNGFVQLLHHELAEAVTNPEQQSPTLGGWWDDAAGCGEIGDRCGAPYDKVTLGTTAATLTTSTLVNRTPTPSNCITSTFAQQAYYYVGGDGKVYYRRQGHDYTDSTWRSAAPSGIQVVGKPGAVSWGKDRVDLFASASGGLQHGYSNDGGTSFGWNLWGSPAVSFYNAASAASWGAQRVDVVVRGADLHVYHRSWDHNILSGWEDWGSPPGGASGPPTIASTQSGDDTFWPLQVVAYVVGTNGHVWQLNAPQSAAPSAWVDTGAPPAGVALQGGLAAAAYSPSGFAVFGQDSGLNTQFMLSDAWAPAHPATWQSLGKPAGTVTLAPGAAALGDGRFVAAAVAGGSVYYKGQFTGSAFGSWVSLGSGASPPTSGGLAMSGW